MPFTAFRIVLKRSKRGPRVVEEFSSPHGVQAVFPLLWSFIRRDKILIIGDASDSRTGRDKVPLGIDKPWIKLGPVCGQRLSQLAVSKGGSYECPSGAILVPQLIRDARDIVGGETSGFKLHQDSLRGFNATQYLELCLLHEREIFSKRFQNCSRLADFPVCR